MDNVIQFPKKKFNGLIVNNKTGKITADVAEDPLLYVGDRVERIRNSLEKINRLMTELKRMEETR